MNRPLRFAAALGGCAPLVAGFALALVTGVGAGCGQRAVPGDWEDEDAGAPDATPAGVAAQSLAAFCAGPARMEVNGVAAPAAVAAHAQWPSYDNEGASVAFTSTATAPGRLVVTWHAPASASPVAPTTLSLSAIPDGWSVVAYAGCSPGEEGCTAPESVIPGAFVGTLAIGGADLGYALTLCLEHDEPDTAPEAAVHAVRLWASAVPALYAPP